MGQVDALNRTYDTALVLEDGTTAAETDTFVGSVAYLDLGTGQVNGEMVFDYSALVIADNDELYRVVLQGSDNSDFSTDTEVELAVRAIGALEVIDSDTDSALAGRLFIPFSNVHDGTVYRYVRLHVVVSGTTPSIDPGPCWLAIRHR